MGESQCNFVGVRELLTQYPKEFSPLYRRFLALRWGAGELRKMLVPWYIMYSPQLGGTENLLNFYSFVIDILKDRKAQEDAENGVDEDESETEST